MSSPEEEPPPDKEQESPGDAVEETETPVEAKTSEQPDETQQADQKNADETEEQNANEVVVEEQPVVEKEDEADEVEASESPENIGPQEQDKEPLEAPATTTEEQKAENIDEELMQESFARARHCAAELLSTVRLLSEELQGVTASPDLEQHLQRIRDNAEEIGKLGTLGANKEEEETNEPNTSQNIESRPSTAERTDGGVAALEEIQQLRQQLHKGDGLTTIEETECEVEELKRVRRQIRYLFGGVLASLPTDTAAIAMQSQAVELYYPQQPESPQHNRNTKNGYGTSKRVDDDASTYSLSSSNASIFTPHSPNDGRRKQDKYRTKSSVERKKDPKDSFTSDGSGRHRSSSHRHDRHSATNSSQDWAREIVKSSLRPQNKWDFSSADEKNSSAASSAATRNGIHQRS